MNILFMDDEEVRHELAEKYLSKEHRVFHAYSANEAMEILKSSQERMGLVMLDHDLQDFVVEEDGMKYERHGVYFLNRMLNEIPEDKVPAQFVVHSYNPVGVNNMCAMLKKAGQIVSALNFSGDTLKLIADRIKAQ